MFLKLKNFLKDESGASMVEYGVALLVVSAIGVALMTSLGDATAANVELACDVVSGEVGACAEDLVPQ